MTPDERATSLADAALRCKKARETFPDARVQVFPEELFKDVPVVLVQPDTALDISIAIKQFVSGVTQVVVAENLIDDAPIIQDDIVEDTGPLWHNHGALTRHHHELGDQIHTHEE